ncbi:hypothetical protein [Streptomyces sp. NPDC088812]|uniref:hypothetical protein n=1 Tax=Streptomyces sp. NPDC088812 TaxID=3365905 RepID=UPI0038263F40
MKRRRGTTMAVLLAAVAVFAGACSGGDDEASASFSSASSGEGDLVAYAKCMRKNGISDFPDPDSNGGLVVPAGVDPNSDAYKKADKACAEYRPDTGSAGSGGNSGWSSEDQVKYAECMRENGVPKFPDPDPNGKGSVIGQGSGVDPDSSAFKKAAEKCAKYQPQGMQNQVPNKQGGGSN